MAERKVLNKYFPADFDPALVPRRKRPRDQQIKVRLMAPFSMQCLTCGEHIAKSRKFNARKELVEGEEYLKIKIFRFYIVCPRCAAEITFKTNPKEADYDCENGAHRNFEPWRGRGKDLDEVDMAKQLREEEEELNPLQALEARTRESKREVDIMDALDEIRTKNARLERVDDDAALDRVLARGGGGGGGDKSLDEQMRLEREAMEDDEEFRRAFNVQTNNYVDAEEGAAGSLDAQIELGAGSDDDEIDDDDEEVEDGAAGLDNKLPVAGKRARVSGGKALDEILSRSQGSVGTGADIGVPAAVVPRRKPQIVQPLNNLKGLVITKQKPKEQQQQQQPPKPKVALSALAAYGSDSD